MLAVELTLPLGMRLQKAILMAWYPGQEGGQAIAEILTGKISPSGKLPISIEKKWEDNPVHDSYYENLKAEIKRVDYSEGVFVGYRGYDRSGKEPLSIWLWVVLFYFRL